MCIHIETFLYNFYRIAFAYLTLKCEYLLQRVYCALFRWMYCTAWCGSVHSKDVYLFYWGMDNAKKTSIYNHTARTVPEDKMHEVELKATELRADLKQFY